MNQTKNTDKIIDISHSDSPEGFIYCLSTSTIFEMDLIGKNLQMNGIEAYWNYTDTIDSENGISTLFVKQVQLEQAHSILHTLDLIDFTIHNGK